MPPETTRDGSTRLRATILLVDDIRSARILGEQLLRRHGYQVLTVASADDALRALDSWHVSAVVADWLMPDGDGLTLLEAVRSWWRLPCVLWTVDESGRDPAERLGIPCVSKHDPPAKLIDALREALGGTSPLP